MLYCPKCQQTYEEGSQRFCNNDGGRLQPVSNAEKAADKPGGVFTNLLSRNVPNKERDEKLAAIPRFVRAEPEPEPIPHFEPEAAPAAPETKDTHVFESDPDDIELELDPVPAPRQEPVFFIPAPEPEGAPEPEAPAPIADEISPVPPVFESNAAPFDPEKPIGRVVRPEDIPSGRAELGDRQFNPAGRAALTWETPEVMIGQTVKGRYRITELSGEDDAGFSYLAEDKIVQGKKVVVRVVMEEGEMPDEPAEQIYLDERVAFSHIVHPNVAGIIDSGELQEGKAFVISEYVEGNSVKSLLENSGQFNVLRTARMIRQSAYALSEMHQNRVIHRNLTPSNIILTVSDSDTEQVKITGFGMPGSSSKRNLVYNAPEVLGGEPAVAASDIYSLAVIAYQMLTNRVPFSGENAKQMLRSQREGMLLSPTNLRLDVSPLVDQILGKGMALVPEDRYPKARDFGDALFNALTTVAPWTNEQEKEEKVELLSSETPAVVPVPPAPEFLDEETLETDAATDTDDVGAEDVPVVPVMANDNVQVLEPLASAETEPAAASDDPAWTKRSPEPPKTGSTNWVLFSIIGFIALLIGIWAIWAYFLRQPNNPPYVPPGNATAPNSYNGPPITPTSESNNRPATENGDVPPERRQIEQPPNTTFFQTSRQNLNGDLARNFVDFSLYYPNDWKVNQGEAATERGMRGKFLDISRDAPNGLLAEQMLVSYYESHGTYSADEGKFAALVEETNKTLKGIIKDYQMLSKGRITVNGGWPAYEVKFQGGGTTEKGEKVIVWGRRLFVPAARPGVKNGFEITMIATSASPDVKSVDDVGNKGGLATVLNTFEPGKNF